MRNGTTVLCTIPDFRDRVFSTGQLTHQSRFQQASAYAKVAAKTIPLYAELAPARDSNAYNLALSDWFHAPVIHAVTRQGGSICIDVTDNVQVTDVRIVILDEQGQTQVQGQAVWVQDARWEYETSTEGTVIVEAFDLAGNITRQEAWLPSNNGL